MVCTNNINDNDFEKRIVKLLQSLGYLFPQTDEEVEAFESINKTEELPKSFSSGRALLSKKRIISILKVESDISLKSQENLAMAARKGKGISDEILRRMRNDREEAENGKE